MSTIDSGVLGIAPGQAPSRGKAAGSSEKGDFAATVASFHPKEGEEGRRGGRISISGNGQGEHEAEPMNGIRAKASHRDVSALAEALRKATAETSGEDGEDKPAAHAGAGRSGRKAHAGAREGGGAETPKAGDPAVDGTKEAAAGGTEVGNLLELLAAPAVPAHAAAPDGAAIREARAQAGGKAAGKVDLSAGGVVAGTDDAAAGEAADAGDVQRSGKDRLFRLARADGKGRELDMTIAGAGDRATLRDASPTGPRGETVTVVDARRYIGLAPTGNAGAVTTAITQDPQWTSSLSATGGLTQAEAATGKVVNTLKIQMHPIELGLVTATLRLQGDALVVSLQVETGEAYRQLNDDQDAIVRALRGHGFAVDQVTVQLAPADRGAGTQQGDGQGQQFSGQPQARAGGNGREGNGEGAGTFGREGKSHEGNTSENAAGLAGGQSVRSGGVYL
ncbi:flagellar hook-length control protein FliK [Shinella sp. PSBB067]|uniref:flagellar hook-length control protein FliK n=1 Tax=Shinella sp. PSBB067 TaxID=2715959 RepID=UPI00193BF62B|nr:flagellar hook-length control protein FliK [Shinella sp. PSBB067]QRI63687.1 flagellar hook-length control protein FliK [Shinella sp. PSBB067]